MSLIKRNSMKKMMVTTKKMSSTSCIKIKTKTTIILIKIVINPITSNLLANMKNAGKYSKQRNLCGIISAFTRTSDHTHGKVYCSLSVQIDSFGAIILMS